MTLPPGRPAVRRWRAASQKRTSAKRKNARARKSTGSCLTSCGFPDDLLQTGSLDRGESRHARFKGLNKFRLVGCVDRHERLLCVLGYILRTAGCQVVQQIGEELPGVCGPL